MKKKILRLLIEVGFIIFLFYSNLIMGEYTKSHLNEMQNIFWAMGDVFTIQNFTIAILFAFIGYVGFEYMRKIL